MANGQTGWIFTEPGGCPIMRSIDWFKGKNTGKSQISWENLWFPVDFPLSQTTEGGVNMPNLSNRIQPAHHGALTAAHLDRARNRKLGLHRAGATLSLRKKAWRPPTESMETSWKHMETASDNLLKYCANIEQILTKYLPNIDQILTKY